MLGFCWGGGTALHLATSGRFAAAGGIHSAYLTEAGEKLVQAATCPVMLLQSGTDPSLKGISDVLRGLDEKTSVVARHSVVRTYWDMNHGWCGATGDRRGNPKVRAATESALATAVEFFTRTLRFMNAAVIRGNCGGLSG